MLIAVWTINREKIKEFLKEEKETETLDEFEKRWNQKERIFICFFFIIINTDRYSQEDLNKIKDGICFYCSTGIKAGENSYRCGNFMCGWQVTFEDIYASITRPAKSEISLPQSTVWGDSQLWYQRLARANQKYHLLSQLLGEIHNHIISLVSKTHPRKSSQQKSSLGRWTVCGGGSQPNNNTTFHMNPFGTSQASSRDVPNSHENNFGG
jgi:hypothetical protein